MLPLFLKQALRSQLHFSPLCFVDNNIRYSLQLMVVPTQSMVMAPGGGFFSVQRVKYPVQTFFFFNEMGGSSLNEISTRTPALLHLVDKKKIIK
uniref:Uncharacterized protein n=1 Tax=Meloidogyne enterolobii TaxID=390850 RepID=A0A6V7TQR4_MELEN|nr:unnamed protein product [Meloidogyne enterolobii]